MTVRARSAAGLWTNRRLWMVWPLRSDCVHLPGKTLVRKKTTDEYLDGMSVSDAPFGRFLVEWYESALAAAPVAETAARLVAEAEASCARGTMVSLVLTMAAGGDDMLFGVFSADAAEAVRRVCRDAGCPPDRITPGVDTYIVADDRPSGR
jgi:hypothetical protein